MRHAFKRWDLEQAKELSRIEWTEGLEAYLALGCFFWAIIITVAGLAAVVWGVMVVLEQILW